MSSVTFLQNYRILNKIGEGSFSEVLKCQDLKLGSFVAAKRLKKKFNNWDEVNECAEIIAMHKLPNHPNILHMSQFHFDSLTGKVTFLFELMDLSLYDFINVRKKQVHESRAKYYLYQILCGLDHLHKNGMFHRDIKPENILLKIPVDADKAKENKKYEIIKIADLGSLRGIYSKPPFTEYISTRWYRSPECLLTSGYYGPKMDVWATGCVFYELLTFKPLFAGSNEVDQLARIHKILGTPSNRVLLKFSNHKSCNYEYFPKQVGKGLSHLVPNMSQEGQTVLKLMITYDPDSRCNIRRLLDHKYFKHLRESETIIRRRSSVEPVGDFKATSFVSSKFSHLTIPKPEKTLKRTYNEMNNIEKNPSTPKEKTRKEKAEKKPKKSSCEQIAPKKYKLSDSYKNLLKEIIEPESSSISKIPKKVKTVCSKNESLPVCKVSSTLKDPKCKLFPTHEVNTYEKLHSKSVNKHVHASALLCKYVNKKKETTKYRNTTGDIPEIFSSKLTEKSKSKSFVEKKSAKFSNVNLISGTGTKSPSKLPIIEPIKAIKKNKRV